MKALSGGCQSCSPRPRLREKLKERVGMYSLPPLAHTYPRGLAVVSKLLSGCFKFRSWLLQAQDKWLCLGAGMGQGICSDQSCSSCFSSHWSCCPVYFHLTCDSPAPASESGHQELQGFGGRYSDTEGREAAVRVALAGSPDL